MAWLYLFAAAVFEMAWTLSLKFMSVKKLKTLHWRGFFNHTGGWAILWPFVGYVVFGLGNVYCISQAMKVIPASTALAIWMATALVGVKLVEIIFLKMPFDAWQFLFIGFIIVGIVGLKQEH